MEIYSNYIHTVLLDLNLDKIKESSYKLHNIVKNFRITSDGYSDTAGKAPLTTKVHEQYNLLMYNFEEFHPLYIQIQNILRQLDDSYHHYYIQCWINIFKKGEFIDWHEHYPPSHNSWHGFYCVNTEPSKTSYKLPNVEECIDIDSKDNMLVISRSNGDWHRTWPWEFSDRDRITIAFDIVPREYLDHRAKFWIPI